MSVTPSVLRKIPLFQNITDAHLGELIGAFERAHLNKGEALFKAGSTPEHLHLLVSGEIALMEGDKTRFVLQPVEVIGELGALTGVPRNTTAVTTKASEVWRIGAKPLMDFFEKHGDVAFPFHHNLLRIVADKVRRDKRALDEVRANLIRTQKAMKHLRDIVLEAPETPISKQICDTLDQAIEQNRRAHYLVEPAFALATSVKCDGGEVISVVELSDAYVKLSKKPSPAPAKGGHWSAVLLLPDAQLPVSGTVESIEGEGMLLKLDLLIDAYAQKLNEHLTRIQMLDFVV